MNDSKNMSESMTNFPYDIIEMGNYPSYNFKKLDLDRFLFNVFQFFDIRYESRMKEIILAIMINVGPALLGGVVLKSIWPNYSGPPDCLRGPL